MNHYVNILSDIFKFLNKINFMCQMHVIYVFLIMPFPGPLFFLGGGGGGVISRQAVQNILQF